MPALTTTVFVATLALVGLVILFASLLSGVVQRTGLPQVAIFLLLGAVLGPAGFGMFDVPLDSPKLLVIATLGLVLVLFTDAIAVDAGEVRRHRRLALLVLGPGTLLPAALVALAAWGLLGVRPAAAAVLGAALASTDPVLLRSLLRHPALPRDARLALRLESGMNDVVLLPVVVIASLFLRAEAAPAASEVGRLSLGLFVLGPLAGLAIGWLAITLLVQIRGRFGVRRDYESLYALGVAFTAYAAAEALHGSGFLAAFAAGLTIAALDVELCDCFLDYGEATAEMFLLLTFVAFGASLIWTGLAGIDGRTLLFAAVALGVRTVALLPVLRPTGLAPRSAWLVAAFGPRGLSSLLLVLLPVFAGIEGADELFRVTALVVLASVVLHGGAIALFERRERARAVPVAADPAVVTAPAEPTLARANAEAVPERITMDELAALRQAGAPVVVLDARTERAFGREPGPVPGTLRAPPDEAVGVVRQAGVPPDATIVAFCA